jgi:sialic acid synthase SpsE
MFFSFSLVPPSFQKHKRKNHCDKNNDSTGNLADLSSNEDDINIMNEDFEKLQVDKKPYQVKYSEIYGRLVSLFSFLSFYHHSRCVTRVETMRKLAQRENVIRLTFTSNSSCIFRYLVVSRDVKKGEVLIETDALVIGPCAESTPICLGCYVDLVMVPRKYQ